MKTYHYCVAFYEGSRTHWRHGVFQWAGDISKTYLDLVDQIASAMSPPRRGDEIVVHSLAVIADDSR